MTTTNGATKSASPPAMNGTAPDPPATDMVPSKRKRSDSSISAQRISPVKSKSPAKPLPSSAKTEATKAKQQEIVQQSSNTLLAALKEYDPSPSVLTFQLSSNATSQSPPAKRAKLSSEPSLPDTIADRLAQCSYSSFNALLSDVSAACRALLDSTTSSTASLRLTNGTSTLGDSNAAVARIIHFERFAKDLVHRERSRRADELDLVEEVDEDDDALSSLVDAPKKALAVNAHRPLFSSLQLPQTVPLIPSSSHSFSSSPDSSLSTKAASISSPSIARTEIVSVRTPLVETSIPNLVSVVNIEPFTRPRSVGVKAESGTDSETKKAKVPTIGEAFAAATSHWRLQPPRTEQTIGYGLQWGGKVGPGGVNMNAKANERSEVAGEWLQYRNHPVPNPFRRGIGLPADFVAAYSSFAPTRDDSLASVPSHIKNNIWWERRGPKVFRAMFGDNPSIGHMFQERESEVVEDELDEGELMKAIEDFVPDEEVPIDSRLLEGDSVVQDEEKENQYNEVLEEIASLLRSLQSEQFKRMAIINHQTPVTATSGQAPEPSEEEKDLYAKVKARLEQLISELPPHVVATIDGHPDSVLNLSTIMRVTGDEPVVFKGQIHTGDDAPGARGVPQVAMDAMNAAAGISPVAPVAMMSGHAPSPTAVHQGSQAPNPPRVSGAPHVTVGSGGQYHGHSIPPQTQAYSPGAYHGHAMPPHTPSPQNVTTPYHYPTPYNPSTYGATPRPAQQSTPRPAPSINTRGTPQQYAGQMSRPPSQNSAQGGGYGMYPNYPTPQQPPSHSPQRQMPQQMQQRVRVPPPQGLAAAGVGPGSYGGSGGGYSPNVPGMRMPQQMSPQGMTPGRYPGGTPTRR